jgi:hypothetical protein
MIRIHVSKDPPFQTIVIFDQPIHLLFLNLISPAESEEAAGFEYWRKLI